MCVEKKINKLKTQLNIKTATQINTLQYIQSRKRTLQKWVVSNVDSRWDKGFFSLSLFLLDGAYGGGLKEGVGTRSNCLCVERWVWRLVFHSHVWWQVALLIYLWWSRDFVSCKLPAFGQLEAECELQPLDRRLNGSCIQYVKTVKSIIVRCRHILNRGRSILQSLIN